MAETKSKFVLLGKGGGGGGTQVQADWTETDTTSMAYIQNKPTLATVATSGSYNDLTGQPTILTQWFGTQAEYDALGTYDPNVIYNIEGNEVDWDEISNKPTFNTETLTFTLSDSTTRTITVYVQ